MGKTLQSWHQFIESGDMHLLENMLDDSVVFHSPVVHTPQQGKSITMMYLMAAHDVFRESKFTYVREVLTEKNWVLEFTATIDGVVINGVDIIQFNDSGKMVDFKVMLRPLKAVNMMHQKMMEMLQKMKDK